MNIKQKIGQFWNSFGKYIYIGIGVLVLLVGLVLLGRWWASGKANEFAQEIHNRWMLTDGRAIYDNIAINRSRIEELDQNFRDQEVKISKIRKVKEKGIDNAIKSGDTKVIASMFDNLVDRYTPPASWGK